MEKITYEPVEESYSEPVTKADLESLYRKLAILYEGGRMPEKIIQIKES